MSQSVLNHLRDQWNLSLKNGQVNYLILMQPWVLKALHDTPSEWTQKGWSYSTQGLWGSVIHAWDRHESFRQDWIKQCLLPEHHDLWKTQWAMADPSQRQQWMQTLLKASPKLCEEGQALLLDHVQDLNRDVLFWTQQDNPTRLLYLSTDPSWATRVQQALELEHPRWWMAPLFFKSDLIFRTPHPDDSVTPEHWDSVRCLSARSHSKHTPAWSEREQKLKDTIVSGPFWRWSFELLSQGHDWIDMPKTIRLRMLDVFSPLWTQAFWSTPKEEQAQLWQDWMTEAALNQGSIPFSLCMTAVNQDTYSVFRDTMLGHPSHFFKTRNTDCIANPLDLQQQMQWMQDPHHPHHALWQSLLIKNKVIGWDEIQKPIVQHPLGYYVQHYPWPHEQHEHFLEQGLKTFYSDWGKHLLSSIAPYWENQPFSEVLSTLLKTHDNYPNTDFVNALKSWFRTVQHETTSERFKHSLSVIYRLHAAITHHQNEPSFENLQRMHPEDRKALLDHWPALVKRFHWPQELSKLEQIHTTLLKLQLDSTLLSTDEVTNHKSKPRL